jgi:transposase
MLAALQHMDIHFLKRQGHSVRQIARLTGHARNTVRAILKAEGLRTPKPRRRQTKLDEHRDYLCARAASGLTAVRLLAELQARGYTGGIHAVRRFLAGLEERASAARRATVRYETGPGEQAQVDWKHVGTFPDAQGRPVTISAFVMVLSFSRALYVRFVTAMSLPVLIDCHLEAFAFFGGVPAAVLYDNMKQVRLGPQRWNPAFLDFAAHGGFTPKTHRPYRPRTKGKVERAIQYLDQSFLHARRFADLAELNAQGLHWCRHTANVRVHATTQRRPDELLAVELPQLAPIAQLRPYAPAVSRKVDAESLVAYHGSRYSVPPEHVGQLVRVQSLGGKVTVRTGELIVAEHVPVAKGRSQIDPAHLQALWQQTVSRATAERHAPPPRCTVTFTQPVEQRPLSVYAEVAG